MNSAVLNPHGRYYQALKNTLAQEYEDNYWAEDALFMERNSRDFVARIERININAEALCQALISSPLGQPWVGILFGACLTRGQSKKCTTPNTALRGHFTMLVALLMEDTGASSRLLYILPLQQ